MSDFRILCVDDEPNILSSLRRMFSLAGISVELATSGAEALAMLAQKEFHLVLSDMLMPEMNGAELLAQVRIQYPKIMRLMLTGTIELTDAMSAVSQGEVHQCLTKPWVDEELISAVKEALEKYARG
jgi:CheY-like chemotaxis protein